MIRNYLTSILAFALIDSVWLGLISPELYRKHIGHLMRDQPDFGAAVLFYLIFLAGLNLLVIHPRRRAPLKIIAGYGAAFGCVTYATFDLTSVAVFKDFPYVIAGIDLVWGSVLSMSVAVITTRLDPDRRAPSD